jgi:hypothetical protein
MRAALIHVSGWDIYYQRVVETHEGFALDSTEAIHRLGEVAQSSRLIDGISQRGWSGTDVSGRSFWAENKATVIDKMAEGNGLRPIELNDTIPPLFQEQP